MNTESVPVIVGIDYAETVVQVVVQDRQGRVLGSKRCPNETVKLVAYAERFGPVIGAAIEACCGAASLADELRHHYGWPVQLAHPGFVRRMKQNPDKTDFADARVLGDLRRVGYLPEVWLAPPELRELRRLVRHRQTLVNEGRDMKLRIRALLRDHRVKTPPEIRRVWTRSGETWLAMLAGPQSPLPSASRYILRQQLDHLMFLRSQQAACEAHLREVVQDDPLVVRLLEEPCVGLVTACTLRAEVGCFDRFHSGRQLAHYCGVTPQNNSSGERQADAGLVRGGNRWLKATLVELAHRLMRYVPRWREFRDRLRQAGKPICVIAAAVANRWVRRLYYDLKTMTPAEVVAA